MREAACAVGFALAYALAAEAGHWLSFEPGHAATFWPASGLYVMVLLAWPKRAWPMMVAAGVVANLCSDTLLHGKSLSLSMAMTLANSVEAVLAALLLGRSSPVTPSLGGAANALRANQPVTATAAVESRRDKVLSGPSAPSLAVPANSVRANPSVTATAAVESRRDSATFSLERLTDVNMLLVAAFIVPLFSSLIAATALVQHYDVSFVVAYFVWWIADCVGMLIMAPIAWACLFWRLTFKPVTPWWRSLELVACFTTLTVCTLIIFYARWEVIAFPFLLLPILHWPALRFGTTAVAASLGVMSVLITLATQAGEGPFAPDFASPVNKAMIVQAFLASASVPFLALAAMWHERERAAEDMEQRIHQRTQQLAEADRRKDHFLAVLAHELRNPLAPLSHALEVWPIVSSDPDKLEDIRGVMSSQVRHMTGLIDDLLDVSRIAGGKILLRKECLDVREVVQTAIASHRSQADRAGHCIRVHVPPSPVMVEGDRARLIQIVGNLLHNAIKYTGRAGEIRIEVERRSGAALANSLVEPSASGSTPSGDQALITVEDNGPGIPREQLDRIFELFTQVDQTLERSHGGLGIGLTLAKNLVELHSGSVRAFSEGVGHGCRFEVTLPCAAMVAGQGMTNPASEEKRKLPVHKILVVDDTHASGRMLGLLLKSLGQQVELCFDGYSALSTASNFQPSIIFLDIAMPGISGYEVATQLKAKPETSHITLVAMTGFGQASDRQRAFEAGFDHHMVKPANIEALTQVIAGQAL